MPAGLRCQGRRPRPTTRRVCLAPRASLVHVGAPSGRPRTSRLVKWSASSPLDKRFRSTASSARQVEVTPNSTAGRQIGNCRPREAGGTPRAARVRSEPHRGTLRFGVYACPELSKRPPRHQLPLLIALGVRRPPGLFSHSKSVLFSPGPNGPLISGDARETLGANPGKQAYAEVTTDPGRRSRRCDGVACAPRRCNCHGCSRHPDECERMRARRHGRSAISESPNIGVHCAVADRARWPAPPLLARMVR